MSQAAGPGAAAATREAVLSRVDYEDFRLLIEGADGEYRASVVESPAGESLARVPIHWSPLAGRLEKEGDVRRVGASLFDAFVTGEVREVFRESMAFASARSKGLRIKLLIDPPELSETPWELLFDGRNRRYIGLSTKTPIVRHPGIPQEVERLSIQPPLRILGLIANPSEPGLPRLDVARERKLIDTALADARRVGLVEIKWLDGGTWKELQDAMLQSWHVFHFCGHGDYDAQANEGYLLLEDAHGRAHRLSATDLGLLLRGQGNVRLAVLNSCKGAVGDTSASSSSTAGALIRAGMGGVVAMQNPISDQAALTFARVTYLAIAKGLPLDAAVGSARVAIKLEHPAPIEWWTPVLHMRSRNGDLFTLPSTPAESHADLPGMEYLGPDVDHRLERFLARERRQKRLFYSWMLAPIPLLGFLTFSSVSSDFVSADIEASGVTFVLSSERELFSELPRLQSFSVLGFRKVLLPGSALPLSPGPNQEAHVRADAADSASWISLQPWTLPGGSEISWDHPLDARAGEYAVSITAGAGRSFYVGMVHHIRLSRFGAAPELIDYEGGSAMELTTSDTSLRLEMQLRQPADLNVPHLTVDSLQMVRQGFNDAGPLAESTVLGARVHVNGRDLVLDATHLALSGLHEADMDKVRLTDRGIAFTISGLAERITVGGKSIVLPSRLQWLIREHLSYLWLGGLAYALILVAMVVSWRTSHVARATSK
jgi:CHAT domain-containing protein